MKGIRKNMFACAMAFMLVIGNSVIPSEAEESYFSGGQGTAEEPYLISTADDLAQLNTLSNADAEGINSAFYKLTENIDMTGKIYDGLGASAPDNSWAGLFKGTIDGDYHVISNLEISNEEDKKSVSSDFARGFIALSEGATLKNLGIDGLNVTTAGRAGGLIAFVSGDTTVENCFVRNAEITGEISGGIIGNAQKGKEVVVKDCYVIANVGLIGQNSSYETTTMERVYCGNNKGQFSQLPGTCKYAYRFRDASTPVTCWNDGVYKNSGITLDEAMSNLGAAFAKDALNNNSGYPILAWENKMFSGGQGTAEEPYLISTADDLAQLNTLSNADAEGINSAFYKLTENIDMTGKIYDGLGASAPDNSWAGLFKGTIDGDYHVISNLEISNEEDKKSVSSDFARGFIALSEGATLKNLGIDGLNVTTAGRAGGLIAFVSGDTTVENCFVRNAEITGEISGGIIGNAQKGKEVVVKDCYVIANVGLIGQNSSYETTTMERVYCGNNKGQFSQLPGTCKYAYRFSDAFTPSTCWNDGEYKNSGITLEEAMSNLGGLFKEDKNSINNDYPILEWEDGIFQVINISDKTVTVKNAGSEAISLTVSVAGFSGGNAMVDICGFAEVTVPAESTYVVPFEESANCAEYRSFVMDSLTNMVPQCSAKKITVE